jgi:outer membrane beta-barrel protein
MSFERQHPILRGIITALSLASLALPALASAETEGKVEKVVVRNRIHHAQGMWEVNPGVGFSLSNQMTEHTNFELGLAYNIWESFALELRGGYALSDLSSVGSQAQATYVGAVAAPETPGGENLVKDFPDLWQMKYEGLVLPRWQPIYGKLNLVTELPVHFQAYLTAGGGVVGLHRQSIIYRQAGNQFLEEDRLSPAFAGGAGMRFWVADWAALKIELLDVAFPDQYREGISRYQATQEPAGADPKVGKDAASPGLTNLLFLNIGTSFQF